MDVHGAWVHWRIDGIFTFFLEVTHWIEEKNLNKSVINAQLVYMWGLGTVCIVRDNIW